jgi:hypothetical protein
MYSASSWSEEEQQQQQQQNIKGKRDLLQRDPVTDSTSQGRTHGEARENVIRESALRQRPKNSASAPPAPQKNPNRQIINRCVVTMSHVGQAGFNVVISFIESRVKVHFLLFQSQA